MGIYKNKCHLDLIKKGFSNLAIAKTLNYWCPGPESNRYGYRYPRDFKSLASTNSATQA